jgi:hypothetical protein
MATQIIKNRPSWLGTLNIGDYASTIAMEYGAEAADNTVLADVSRSNAGGLLTFGFSADTYADYTNADLAIFNGVNTMSGLGPELASNVASDWSPVGGGSAVQDGEWVLVTGAGAADTGISLEIPTVNGETYLFNMEIELITSSRLATMLSLTSTGGGDAFSPSSFESFSQNGTFTYSGICTDTTFPSNILIVVVGAGLTARIKNISVKQVFNANTGFGPELKGLVSQWTLNDAASHTLTDPSTITVNNTSGGSDYTANDYVVNAEYSVTYTVSNYSAGIVGLSFGSGAINIARTGNGTYTETGINSGSPLIYVLSNTGTQCTIVIDSIKKVSDAVPLTFATGTGAEYETAFLINALQVSATPISGTVGDMAGANISGNAVGRLVKGIIGANRLSATSSVIPTGSQLGPVAAGQSIYANLHVTAATVAAGGYLVLYVQSDDNPNFTSYTNRVNFDFTSEVSSQSLSLAGPITDEYWRAACYISNGSFSVAVSLGIA